MVTSVKETWLWTSAYSRINERKGGHMLTFPGLPLLSIEAFVDWRRNTVMLCMRYRGGADEQAALERWASSLGFDSIEQSRWSENRRRRFRREISRFNVATVSGGFAMSVVDFCSRLQSRSRAAVRVAAAARSSRASAAAPRRKPLSRLALGTRKIERLADPSAVSALRMRDAAQSPTIVEEDSVDIPITFVAE